LEVAFNPRLAEGLDKATTAQLAAVEISPSGLGLHWPKLDADLYVPALLEGVFGSPRWMAKLGVRPASGDRRSPGSAAPRSTGRAGRARKAARG
jgi:hypothetical protein